MDNQEGNKGDTRFKKGTDIGKEYRWKKGESGNPNGRRNAYTDLIKDFSFSKVGERERREVVISKLFQLAHCKLIQISIDQICLDQSNTNVCEYIFH